MLRPAGRRAVHFKVTKTYMVEAPTRREATRRIAVDGDKYLEAFSVQELKRRGNVAAATDAPLYDPPRNPDRAS
jgi:hypothetical protein